MAEEVVSSPLGISSLQSAELDKARRDSLELVKEIEKREGVTLVGSQEQQTAEIPKDQKPVDTSGISDQIQSALKTKSRSSLDNLNKLQEDSSKVETKILADKLGSHETDDKSQEPQTEPSAFPPLTEEEKKTTTPVKVEVQPEVSKIPIPTLYEEDNAGMEPERKSDSTKFEFFKATKFSSSNDEEVQDNENDSHEPDNSMAIGSPRPKSAFSHDGSIEPEETPKPIPPWEALLHSRQSDRAKKPLFTIPENEAIVTKESNDNNLAEDKGETSKSKDFSVFDILCCCCPSSRLEELEYKTGDLRELGKSSMEHTFDSSAATDGHSAGDREKVTTFEGKEPPVVEQTKDEPSTSPEPTTADSPSSVPNKINIVPPIPVATVAEPLQEEVGTGLDQDVKYSDYKARFPDTPEEELKRWASTCGCYMVLDEATNKFYAQWSRKSIPNALAFFTINDECVEPTRQLNSGEKINLLMERGAIKKLSKSAMVAFCKQAVKYDGYFSLLNTTLWSQAGLGNLEVVWLNGDETLTFTKRGTEPVNLSEKMPVAVGAVDNTFRLQGGSPRRRLSPKWTKTSFVSTIRSITDSAYGEIDPRSKAPRR